MRRSDMHRRISPHSLGQGRGPSSGLRAARSRCARGIITIVFAALLVGLEPFCEHVFAHSGQYRGPVSELRELFRGQNPRLRPNPPEGPLRRVPPVGSDGQGYLRWEFWWEHNKDRYLGLRNYQNRERASVVRGSTDYWLGGRVRDRIPVTDAIDETLRTETIAPLLLRGTTHGDADVRAASWVALGKVGSKLEVETFKRGVQDSNDDVRKAALLGLGLYGDHAAIPTLMHVMRSGSQPIRVRMAAALGLAFIEGPASTKMLLGFLESVLPRVQNDAEEMAIITLRALAIHGDLEAVPVLQRLSKTASAKDSRIEAELILALGRLGDRSSIPMLLRALGDRSIPTRRAAAIALGEIDTHSRADAELTQLLAHRERWKDDDSISDEAMAELDALIVEKEKVDAAARKEIVKQRDAIAKALIEAIDDDNDVQVRNYACISLAKNGGNGALRALLAAFDSGYSISLQGFAALGLGILGEPAASDVLLERLNKAGYESHRGAVALALGFLRERAALPALAAIVGNTGADASFRGYAAQAIGLIGDRDLVPDLHRMLAAESGNEELLRGVVLAVGMLGDRGSLQPLARVLSDSKNPHTREVRAQTVLALGLIRDRGSVDAMAKLVTKPVGSDRNAKSQTQAYAAAALGYLGDREVLPRLSALARDHEYRVFVQGLDDLLTVL